MRVVVPAIADCSAPASASASVSQSQVMSVLSSSAPMFVSNATDEGLLLKEIGLKPGQFFIEVMDMDGLGFCGSEEELDILYGALTGEDIEENLES